jgi:mutator protein MutT
MVGVGVIIVNKEGQILVGKRKGNYAPRYSIPGGHLELGETFEEAAIREVKEETGLEIKDPKVIAVTNNLETFQEEGRHYISLILIARKFKGKVGIFEKRKCQEWLWCDPHHLPIPHFDASRLGVECYISGQCYLGVTSKSKRSDLADVGGVSKKHH